MRTVFAGVLLLASGFSSFGQSAFTGTWVTDLKSAQYSGNPLSFSLKDGTYRCDTCWPKVEIPADGKDYPVKGDPGITSVALKKIDANTIEETDKLNGQVIFISRMTVSPDGQTMTVESTDKLHGTRSTYQAKKH